jgi:hypothetical protein
MLSPDARSVVIDLLRPPPGYHLDQAVLTTYSLDLEALLALPLAVLAHADGGLDELLADPLLLLEALRQAGDRVHVFVDEGGIAVPRSERPIYAMLESSVHPVRAPNGGAFHPKVWIARFLDATNEPLLRVAVLSRNLTFDRSWDIALTSEASFGGGRRSARSRDLGDLLRALPELSVQAVPPEVLGKVQGLAAEVERTRFPCPDGFDDEITFQAIGLPGGRRRTWQPRADGSRLLAIAPYANRTALDALSAITTGGRSLVSRQETLDALSEDALAPWDTVLVLSDAAADESDDEMADRPTGLHAKMIGIEHGWDVSWFVGSANLTAAAFQGHNVEVMASVIGRKGRKDGRTGAGIDRFLDGGFYALCEPYHRAEGAQPSDEVLQAQQRLEAARKMLMGDDALRVTCTPDGESWQWSLSGQLSLPDGVEVVAWPLSVSEDQAKALTLPTDWTLPTARLTAFVAFRVHALGVKVDDMRFTLKLPAEGLPEGRLAHVLRTLIDSPERFLRFLRALLGGLDGLVDWSADTGKGTESFQWGIGLGGETLLEDLVRVASRDPKRLEPVKKLIDDLRSTEEGRRIVPDDLYAMWVVVEGAIRGARINAAS